MVLAATEFFRRHDAINVFDQLWSRDPFDLLSLSSVCKDLREAVNSYCASNKRIKKSSSSEKEFPSVCRLVRWWMCHCLSCKDRIEPSQCIVNSNDAFLPQTLEDYKVIPICRECKKESELMAKITKTDAKSRYGLTEKDINNLNYEARTNPVYRSAAAMKLFYVSDVESAALKKFKLSSVQELLDFIDERRTKRATRTEQIRERKKLSNEERRNNLKNELEKVGLELRSDSQIADWYITNSKRAHTLEKSVELIRRAHIVHQHVGEYYRHLLDVGYEGLKGERYNHEEWSDLWLAEKLRSEDAALKLFAKAKANESLVAESECKCGEPLFDEADLRKLR